MRPAECPPIAQGSPLGPPLAAAAPFRLVWSDNSISECPGCGATVVVGILSLAATCRIDGYYYVDVDQERGWYSSREAYAVGAEPLKPANSEGR
jgi:hypothetical protein